MLVGRSDDESVSGLLRGATLFHASIFQSGEQGPIASSADFLRGVNWLIKSGVTVINASVTSPTENAVVLYAMSLLSREKVVLVAAAGNRGPSAAPVYPAAIPSAFAVTAVSIEGDAYRYANVGDYIDISAPGIDLPTTSRKITSGTSLAVPFVTAAVARIVQVCGVPRWRPKRACKPMPATWARRAGIRILDGGCFRRCRAAAATTPRRSSALPAPVAIRHRPDRLAHTA